MCFLKITKIAYVKHTNFKITKVQSLYYNYMTRDKSKVYVNQFKVFSFFIKVQKRVKSWCEKWNQIPLQVNHFFPHCIPARFFRMFFFLLFFSLWPDDWLCKLIEKGCLVVNINSKQFFGSSKKLWNKTSTTF